MANMSYCRFENTLGDLKDCWNSLMHPGDDDPLSEREQRARNELIKLCNRIAAEFTEEDFEPAEDN